MFSWKSSMNFCIYSGFDTNKSSYFHGEFELGRQNGLYLKSELLDFPHITTLLMPDFLSQPPLNSEVDAYYLRIQSDIVEHSDIVPNKHHYRLNICLNDWIGYNIGNDSVIVRKGSGILFKSDMPHSAFIEKGSVVDVVSFGIACDLGVKLIGYLSQLVYKDYQNMIVFGTMKSFNV